LAMRKLPNHEIRRPKGPAAAGKSEAADHTQECR
jgi:hypothetical protein